MATAANSATSIEMFSEPGVGTVDVAITATEHGRVQFQATYWPARLYRPGEHWVLSPGMRVKVLGRDNITLLVMPESITLLDE